MKEALLSRTSQGITFALVKRNFAGEFKQKEIFLMNQIIEYFYRSVRINISYEYFLPRLEPSYSDPRTMPDSLALIVYGVDFLSTK